MENFDQPSDPITLVISEVVEPRCIQAYEAWSRGFNQAAQQFEGFLGVNVIRPRDHDHPEYVVIVKFDSYNHFRAWRTSPTFQQWVEKGRDLVVDRSQQQFGGVELWFSSLSLKAASTLPQPAYYKNVVLGVLAVYPLILLADVLLGQLLKPLPHLLGLLISVTFVSALLTYPVMPCLTWLLDFWLYPASSRSASKY
ncbi:antibiotic biosynthesis monooxygenase [Phormidium sp. FACHB-592]|uniref:Antibiotic biosynthesis monooxygenase n=1 Tax=Stenomitos frigidus AS-A4 TaxID=2933935 RepID=A0ABV0KHE8_9CYAN|nr:antibiotic biosynthesis monooxygenase [Phormidium sp. FACHB-592]MBD2073566.1 antibiotic biosynthesis monooxygenase [Phormidium sp. FACHB-592]